MDSYLVVSACVLVAAAALYVRSRRFLPLPPGPSGLPILGSYFNRPDSLAWEVYASWSATYNSDIVSFHVLGVPTIILNSAKAIDDLFEKRSAIYSNRPTFNMLLGVMGWSWDWGFVPYSQAWRFQRKVFHQFFNANKVDVYKPVQTRAAHELLKSMIRAPEMFLLHIRHHSVQMIFDVTYGYEIKPQDDPLVQLLGQASMSVMDAMTHGDYLVDYFPILKYIQPWVPFFPFKKLGVMSTKEATALLNKPFDTVIKATEEGKAVRPSFVSASLEHFNMGGNEDNLDQKQILDSVKNSGATALTGGADTTPALTMTTILAMVLNPDIQARVQAELDAVVGSSRPPSFEDQSKLPFINAVITESMRWRPAVPLALAHAAVSDDEYKGYRIPAGAAIYGNTWALLHDAETYPDPETYNPDRFLGKNPQADLKTSTSTRLSTGTPVPYLYSTWTLTLPGPVSEYRCTRI